MIQLSYRVIIVLSVLVLTMPAFAVDDVRHAHHSAEQGVCDSGEAQSPINVAEYQHEDSENLLALNYVPTRLRVTNNGHTVQANFDPGSSMSIGSKRYDLLYLDFHTPSEHYIDGVPYPMESHLMHRASDGTLAVVTVMLKVGKLNPVIQGIWDNIKMTENEENMVERVMWSVPDFMPESKAYYHYEGSLTVAPCTEGIQWYIMQEPVELSQEQLNTFQKIFPANARPIQDLNGRVVTGN